MKDRAACKDAILLLALSAMSFGVRAETIAEELGLEYDCPDLADIRRELQDARSSLEEQVQKLSDTAQEMLEQRDDPILLAAIESGDLSPDAIPSVSDIQKLNDIRRSQNQSLNKLKGFIDAHDDIAEALECGASGVN